MTSRATAAAALDWGAAGLRPLDREDEERDDDLWAGDLVDSLDVGRLTRDLILRDLASGGCSARLEL